MTVKRGRDVLFAVTWATAENKQCLVYEERGIMMVDIL